MRPKSTPLKRIRKKKKKHEIQIFQPRIDSLELCCTTRCLSTRIHRRWHKNKFSLSKDANFVELNLVHVSRKNQRKKQHWSRDKSIHQNIIIYQSIESGFLKAFFLHHLFSQMLMLDFTPNVQTDKYIKKIYSHMDFV